MRHRGAQTVILALTPWLGLVVGCGSTKMTGTVRTGTEQLLLTNAWDDALRRVDFRPLAGVPIFLDAQYISAPDQGWIVSSLRQAMLSQGVLIKSKAEQAQWVVEARLGAYGTNEYSWLIGIPQTNVPAVVPGVPAGTIPEIPMLKKSDQHAWTKMALFAYDRASGQMVWNSGTMLATSNAKDIYLGGVGPIQSGSIWKKKKKVGVNIPLISDPEPMNSSSTAVPGGKIGAGNAPAFSPPPMGLPASASDLESFSP